MKVRMLKTCRIRGVPHELGREYDVEDSLARWMFTRSPPLAEGVKPAPPVEVVEEAPEPKPPAPQAPPKPTVQTAYDKLLQLLEMNHLVEIYGPFGSGKTNLVYHIALEAQQAGKHVYYFDTEGGIPDTWADRLQYYEYIDDLFALAGRIRELAETGPTENGLIIADSIGYPLYARYKELIDEEPGKRFTAWQDLLPATRWAVRFARGIRGERKDEWIRRCSNLSIMTNQPVSEIRREKEAEILPPFGGKLSFLPKLVMHSEQTDHPGEFKLVSWKSIKYRRGQELARFRITREGVSVDWLVT